MRRMQERGFTVDKSFKGVFTMGGRMDGMDCAVSNQDINGKVSACDLLIAQSIPVLRAHSHCKACCNSHFPDLLHSHQPGLTWRSMHSSIALLQSETCVQSLVIIGGGAFACEAMRSAVWNGAASVTLLTREKNKWAYRSLRTCTSQHASQISGQALNWVD